MDKLSAMSILIAAVDTGSLSGASRKLGIPLATVSRRVSELEACLNTRLMNRTSRRLLLTEAGTSYVGACRQVLERVDEIERKATGEFSAARGDLILTAPLDLGQLHVLPIVLDFLKVYPEINVRLVLSEHMLNLQEHQADLAVRISELPDSGLVATRIGVIRRVVCGSATYFSKRGFPKKPRDLKAHDCICFGGRAGHDIWEFRDGKSKVAVTVNSRFVVNTAESMLAAALSGLGITRILSFQAAKTIRSGRLAVVLREFESPPVPVSLIHAKQALLPLKLRVFLDYAAPRLRARLAKV